MYRQDTFAALSALGVLASMEPVCWGALSRLYLTCLEQMPRSHIDHTMIQRLEKKFKPLTRALHKIGYADNWPLTQDSITLKAHFCQTLSHPWSHLIHTMNLKALGASSLFYHRFMEDTVTGRTQTMGPWPEPIRCRAKATSLDFGPVPTLALQAPRNW